MKILVNESIDKPQSLSATDTVERIAGLIILQKPSDCCDRVDEALFDILLNVSAIQSGALACSQSITLNNVVATWLRKNKALRQVIQILSNEVFYDCFKKDAAFIDKLCVTCELALRHQEEYADLSVNLINQLAHKQEYLARIALHDWEEFGEWPGVSCICAKVERYKRCA